MTFRANKIKFCRNVTRDGGLEKRYSYGTLGIGVSVVRLAGESRERLLIAFSPRRGEPLPQKLALEIACYFGMDDGQLFEVVEDPTPAAPHREKTVCFLQPIPRREPETRVSGC